MQNNICPDDFAINAHSCLQRMKFKDRVMEEVLCFIHLGENLKIR